MRPLAHGILLLGLIGVWALCSAGNLLFFTALSPESSFARRVIPEPQPSHITSFTNKVAKTPMPTPTWEVFYLKTKKYTHIEAGGSTGVSYGIQSVTTSLPPHFWKTLEFIRMKRIELNDALRFFIQSCHSGYNPKFPIKRNSKMEAVLLSAFTGRGTEFSLLTFTKIIRDSLRI